MMRRFVLFILPAVLMSVAMVIASHLPGVKPPDLGIDWQDKLFHAVSYAVYGLLLRRAIGSMTSNRIRVLTVCIGIAWALSDEWHQSFIPGRMAEWGDVIADAIGVSVSLALPSSSWVLSAPSASSEA
jgi:VanZ family protein